MRITMKISVVIPAYNEEAYISRCLSSLLEQHVKPDEIIVVDNNSTDQTVAIAKNFPVRIIHETKQGTGHARNRGFNEAKFDIIARTDADTILPPDWIEKIKKAFVDQKLIALSGPAEFYDLPELVQNTHWQTNPAWVKVITSYNKIIRQFTKHDCLFGPNCAFRKSAWEKIINDVCLDDKKVHEDLDLGIHLAEVGKIKFDDSLIVSTSVRRWKRPDAYIEYLYRGFKSLQKHKQFDPQKQGKRFVKKIFLKAFNV